MVDKAKVEQAIRLLLEGIGEDVEREGLKETPNRIARMCEEIYGGLDQEADEHLLKQFEVENNEMVLEKDITFYSMCEHHLMPFYGKAHIAYIPDGKVTGLSKLARSVISKGRHGNAGGRTYLYDHARHQKTGQQNHHYYYQRTVQGRP